MKLSIALLALACAGCASVLGNAPTFEYCPEVHYDRVGNMVDIKAKCALPIGGGALPVPKPM